MVDMNKISFGDYADKNLKIEDVYGFKTNKGIYLYSDYDIIFFDKENAIKRCGYNGETIGGLCQIYGEKLLKIYYNESDLKITIEEI